MSTAVCDRRWQFEGSEDVTLWKAGLAFVSSGLVPSATQRGLILLLNLTGHIPSLWPLPLRNLSSTFGFRPHGLHLDNKTQRLYAVSHSAILEEESIFVFDIASSTAGAPPSLSFRYALTSPRFVYHPRDALWFLNDVAAVDGANELYVTQLGPLKTAVGFTKDKALWRCTWREADRRDDGRLGANCSHAISTLAYGLNGISIHPQSSALWVNDEFGGPGFSSQVWPFARTPDGRLEARTPMPLNGSSIDNIERDFGSGALQMGLYARRGARESAELRARLVRGKSGTTYGPATLPVVLAANVTRSFQVSSALDWGRWTVLGSPWDVGPIVCERRTGQGETLLHPPTTVHYPTVHYIQ